MLLVPMALVEKANYSMSTRKRVFWAVGSRCISLAASLIGPVGIQARIFSWALDIGPARMRDLSLINA